MYQERYFRPIIFNTALPFDMLRSRYATSPMELAEHHFQELRFGQCIVDVPKKTVMQILIDEILDPQKSYYLIRDYPTANDTDKTLTPFYIRD